MLWSATLRPAFLQDIGAAVRTSTSCTAIVQTQNNLRFRKLDKLDRSRKMASLRDWAPVTALMTRQTRCSRQTVSSIIATPTAGRWRIRLC
jgi:hypothetical protein